MALLGRRSRTTETRAQPPTPAGRCPELAEIGLDPATDPAAAAGHTDECEDCMAIGENHWSHLRKCLECGHVACCDSSPRRHATAHFHSSGHPVMRSAEPGELWRWCYIHQVVG
ncbi:UBP-type zinc finger domain-containing protein [Gordonia sp. L191]|uniref:UBP-type zinc finger domain-containing protein n=1 Tax=Gordonia TaxID=2053 RepID=UPI001AD68607|nr:MULTISPECIES: UBP-type zinc finger domain-containing protein [Gordonia]QTI68846.1 UBP-type zinc finger domain-containing protein [Gordonia polyisoprenivorans]WHU47581.1 UBP-type zinc finger domain-containing protein [Gordonia sp. L191]